LSQQPTLFTAPRPSRKFITPSVHLCLQHVGRDALVRDGWASCCLWCRFILGVGTGLYCLIRFSAKRH